MICTACGGDLKVKHSYGTDTSRVQSLECVECLTIHTARTTIVNANPGRGEGAAALAAQIKAEEKAGV